MLPKYSHSDNTKDIDCSLPIQLLQYLYNKYTHLNYCIVISYRIFYGGGGNDASSDSGGVGAM